MSRATFTSVFNVAGVSVVASAAHASSMPIPALAATATTGSAVAAPCRKIRRLYLPRRSTSLMGHPPLNIFVDCLTEAATLLNHLDLVAVGIGDAEKARQRGAVMLEITQRPGRQFLSLEPGVLGIEIVDDDGEMAISVARKVGLLSPEIHRQLEFERRRRVVQINQSEVRKYQAIGNLQVKRSGVEIE